MKREKLKQISEIVKKILQEDELARKDDNYLILRVIEQTNPEMVGTTFSNVMLHGKSQGISFEGITRCRRKIQKKYPELKDDEIAERRNLEQKEYIEYSRE